MVTNGFPLTRDSGELFGVLTIDIDMDNVICVGGKSCEDSLVCEPGYAKANDGVDYFCAYCEAGTYSLREGSDTCETCPSGAFCPGGDQVLPREGYWQPENYKDLNVPVFKCYYRGDCCPPTSEKNSLEACATDSPNRCAPGKKGPLCSECAENYTRFGFDCMECGASSGKKLLGMATFPLLLTFIFSLLPPVRHTGSKMDMTIEILDVSQLIGTLCRPNLAITGPASDLLYYLNLFSGRKFYMIFDVGPCPFKFPQSLDNETLGIYIWEFYAVYVLICHLAVLQVIS